MFGTQSIHRFVIASLTVCFSTALGFVFNQSVSAKQKVIYLTFDDGSEPVSIPQILNVLRREHVHATFFFFGVSMQQNLSIVRRIKREGHKMGNHG